jgi:hypothetical protein
VLKLVSCSDGITQIEDLKDRKREDDGENYIKGAP